MELIDILILINTIMKFIYRLGMANSNMIYLKFHLIQIFFDFCHIPIITCLKCVVISYMANLKFHQFEKDLTGV